MKKSTKVVLGVLAVIVVFFVIFRLVVNSAADSGKYDSFTQCLTDKDVKMYGAFWCPRCQDQKKIFGSSVNKLNYIECSLPDRSAQTEICIAAGIQSYPTWEFADGSRAQGELTFEELSLRSGCELPAE